MMIMRFFGFVFLLGSFAAHSYADTLGKQLEAKSAESKVDSGKKKIMEDAIKELRKSKLTARAKKVGDVFPAFALKNAEGQDRSLKTFLEKGPVIVTFYRGSWCPYCNIQLMEYQKSLNAWEKMGAKLVALSPELPELSRKFAESRALTFDLLFDKDNEIAKKVGLVFGVKADLRQVYEEFGLDLTKSQGNADWQLPIAATYVIGQDGRVKYAFVDVDYKKRAEPSEIEAALKSKK